MSKSPGVKNEMNAQEFKVFEISFVKEPDVLVLFLIGLDIRGTGTGSCIISKSTVSYHFIP